MSREEAIAKHNQYNVDGIMIGRGIFHNPWLFRRGVLQYAPTTAEKLQLLIDHIQLFTDTWGDKKPFEMMKKFYKMYISDIPNAHNLRMELMALKTAEEVLNYDLSDYMMDYEKKKS